jgi:hypothetical protein
MPTTAGPDEPLFCELSYTKLALPPVKSMVVVICARQKPTERKDSDKSRALVRT